MSELELQDAILRNALQLLRLSAGEQAEVDAILRELERELKLLLESKNISRATKTELKALIAEARTAIDARYAIAAKATDTHALAIIVAEHSADLIEPLAIGAAKRVTAETLASLTKDVLIEGAPSSAWWAKGRDDLAFKFAAQVRQGVINGETNERIVQRIVGKRGEPGIMEAARRNARSLVHSSVMSAANDARLATYRKNSGIIAGVRWLATLDGHVCPRCAALDGQSWDLDGNKLTGTTVEFMAPPIHWNDRCVLSPIPKRSALEAAFPGISKDLDAIRTRPSASGQVPGKTTFDQFLKRQPASFVDKVLGKGRADLFRAGKITVRDLVSATGRELTLEQLSAL
jgi:SPP1 gp7 family putative phage head morphogenesis protein